MRDYKSKGKRPPREERFITTPPVVGVSGTFRDRDFGDIVIGEIVDRHVLENRSGKITNIYITVNSNVGDVRICWDPAPILVSKDVRQSRKPKTELDELDWTDYISDDYSQR